MTVVRQNRSRGLAHRHRWRDYCVMSRFRGISIMEPPAKRVKQVCAKDGCRAEREQIRMETGLVARLQDRFYGRH